MVTVTLSVACFQSEERGKKESPAKAHLRPMARSTDASLEHMRGGGSSPSVLSGSPEAEDDCGMYFEPFSTSAWIFISDLEEMRVWHKAPPADTLSQGKLELMILFSFLGNRLWSKTLRAIYRLDLHL